MLYSECRHVTRHEVRKMKTGLIEYIEGRVLLAIENRDHPTYAGFLLGVAIGRLNADFINGELTRPQYDAQYDLIWDTLKTIEGGPQ